jgi:SOS-response transcriptional repressor LexA
VVTDQRFDAQAFAARLRDLRLGQDMSREDLAATANVSASYIKKLEEAAVQRPGHLHLGAIARALGFDSIETMTNGGRPDRRVVPPAEPHGNVVGRLEELRPSWAKPLPVYRWGSCGDPRDTEAGPDPDHLEYAPVGKDSLIGPRGFGVEVKGDSMSRRGISDGDTVWVNPDTPPRAGRTVLANCRSKDGTDHGMVVKVWATDRFGTALFSDGEDDRMDVECDEFTLIGPVVWIQPKGYPPR